MRYEPQGFVNLVDPSAKADFATLPPGSLHAVAGIGHPERFFDLLRELGLAPMCHPFPDHHRFIAADLDFAGARAILMTEKDAVKCRAFADARMWFLPIEAAIDPALVAAVEEKLHGREAH